MQALRTPWANTLRITGPIFIHDAAEGKLSQVAGYADGVPRQAGQFRPLGFEADNFPGSG
jgi:hypothetical protein